MKKAIYLLVLAVVAITIAFVATVQEVEGLREQTTVYEQTMQELRSEINLRDAQFFELSSVEEARVAKIEELSLIIEDKNKTIFELREQLKLQQEEELRLASLKVVFNANDVTIPSGITIERMEALLKGTNLAPLASKYVEIEQEHGINALYLAAKSAWETGWGTSDQAIYKNNMGGVKNPGSDIYRTFSSKEASLDYIAKVMKISYLNEDGKYNNGKSVTGVAQMYNFGNKNWIDGITSIANGFVAKANR